MNCAKTEPREFCSKTSVFSKYAQGREAAGRDLSPLSGSSETVVMIGVSCIG